MCGIFGFCNFHQPLTRREITAKLIQGLRRLEYRGYDSAGFAVDGGTDQERTGPIIIKEQGNIERLVKYQEEFFAQNQVDGNVVFSTHVGIAHTRWATHGPPSRINSHPHSSDPTHEFIVVHNGIITNYKPLKTMLEKKGFQFVSETDTEVIAKMAKFLYMQLNALLGRKPAFTEVGVELVRHLEGAFACLLKSTQYPNEILAFKRGSPLLVGLVEREGAPLTRSFRVETFTAAEGDAVHKDVLRSPFVLGRRLMVAQHSALGLVADPDDQDRVAALVFASDPSAVIEHTRSVMFFEDGDLVHAENGRIHVMRQADASQPAGPTDRITQQLHMELDQIMKGNFPHFMLKEIHEQPESLLNTMRGRVHPSGKITLGGIQRHLFDIRRARRLVFIACGTSYHSALATRPIVEELTRLPVSLENASDFLDRAAPIFRDDVCVFISQSGETADTLSALHVAKRSGAITVGITNTVGSAIARQTDCGIHINAGVEIGVASTKAYSSQVVSIVMFALQLSEDNMHLQERRQQIIADLQRLPDLLRRTLATAEAPMQALAEQLRDQKSLILLGRGYQYASCVEGALKIKELAYMHSEGLLAGELKHGPLALIDESIPVLLICLRDACYDKTQNAFAQLLARRSRPIVLCSEGDEHNWTAAERVIPIPHCDPCLLGVLSTVPLQLLSYHLAVKRGCDVDQPRNLAKSVTVH